VINLGQDHCAVAELADCGAHCAGSAGAKRNSHGVNLGVTALGSVNGGPGRPWRDGSRLAFDEPIVRRGARHGWPICPGDDISDGELNQYPTTVPSHEV
jgi:hypothetical protein